MIGGNEDMVNLVKIRKTVVFCKRCKWLKLFGKIISTQVVFKAISKIG